MNIAINLPSRGQIKTVALYSCFGFIAVFFGMASAVLPPVYLLAFFSIPLGFVLATAYPSLAFSGALVVMFGLLPPFIFASLPLGGATLRPPELILILLFITVGFRSLGSWGRLSTPIKPLILPLAILCCGLFIGLVKGKVFMKNPQAMAEARQYIGWLALPLGLWIAHYRPGKLHLIVMWIALLAAAAMVFQLGSGIQLIYGFRGAEELSKEFKDVTRSAIGGGTLFLCYAAYYLFGKFCNDTKNRFVTFLGLLLIVGGIAATFSRAVWAGALTGGLVFLWITPRFKSSKAATALIFSAIALVGTLALGAAAPRVGAAIEDRILSIADEGKKGSSIGFRFDENTQAIESIKKSPIFGIGLGGEYKRVFRQGDIGGGFNIETSFIHNAYLALWLKFGLAGFLFPILLALCLYAELKEMQRKENTTQPEISAFAALATLVMMYVESFTSPDWSQQGHISAASVMLVFLFSRALNSPTQTTSIPRY